MAVNNPTNVAFSTTLSSNDGSKRYMVRLKFEAVPATMSSHSSSMMVSKVSNLGVDQGKYMMAYSDVKCTIHFLNPDTLRGELYSSSTGNINIKLGKDTYSYSLNGLSRYTSEDPYYPGYEYRVSLGRHYHNPSGVRNADYVQGEIIENDPNSKIHGIIGSNSTALNYPNLIMPSLPSTNYFHISPDSSITIYTNRKNSDLTHTLKYTLTEKGGSPGNGASKVYRDNVTLATGVGESYTWSSSALKTLFDTYAKDSNGNSRIEYDFTIFIRCDTYYNGSMLGTSYTAFRVQYDYNGAYDPVIRYAQFTGSNYKYNNQIYLIKNLSNIGISGYAFKQPSGHSCYNVRGHDSNLAKAWMRLEKTYYNSNFSSGTRAGSFSTSTSNPITISGTDCDNLYYGVDHVSGYYGNSNLCREYIWDRQLPSISSANVYRVDSNDNVDSEGSYIHISLNGQISHIGGRSVSIGSYYSLPFHNINYMTASIRYKKTTDSSWSSSTIVTENYDNSIQLNMRFTNTTFDPTLSYDIELTLSDRWSSTKKTFSLRPPIILIDYNKSGKSLSFGKMSEATADETIIESIFPIIFSDNVNRVSSLNSGTTALVTQRGTNSSNYYNIFVQRTSTNSRAYGITCMDTDSSSNAVMRLNCFGSRLDIMYRKMQFYQWATDYYWEVNPESTYCNINTNSSYFYFNKQIYVNGSRCMTVDEGISMDSKGRR